MSFFSQSHQISVKPNQIGYVYTDNIFNKKLEPGVHKISGSFEEVECFCIPTTSRFKQFVNQEILSKDNIAFRFSFGISYRVSDGLKFLNQFELNKTLDYIFAEAEQKLHIAVQVLIRQRIAQLNSSEINEKRTELFDKMLEELKPQFTEMGIEIERVLLIDLTFPKTIQDLFAKQLEATIRSKTDLENARTEVASARALKNASELMKDDENIKFLKVLETLTKIAQKGNHTFVIGDYLSNKK